MPVTFISNGYDTTVDKPYGESAWADAHPAIGTARYGVRSPLDWKVTAVAGQDRTVSINAGKGFGHGVTDKTVENDTIQLATITSGSRWDLIVARRDWTPTAGVTKFEKIAGGATVTLPGGRQVGPGNIDDQPLALVQVTAGQTQPTGIIDLRTWSGDGGGIIAAHDLVRSFMDSVGTHLWINGLEWVRRVGANDTPEWVCGSDAGSVNLTPPDAGWSVVGGLVRTRVPGGLTMVTCAARVTRAAAPAGGKFPVGPGFSTLLAGFIPSGWRPAVVTDAHCILNNTGAAGITEPVVRVGTDGTLAFRPPAGGASIEGDVGWFLSLNMSWYQ